MSQYSTQRRSPAAVLRRSVLAVPLSVVLLLASVPWVDAAQPPVAASDPPAPSTWASLPRQALGLADCLDLGWQYHARIAAQRASLAAAEDGLRALESLHVPDLLVRELPIRRRQAARGVTAAAAGLDQAQRETTYAVTRTYFTVLFARDQERVARAVVDRLTAARDTAKKALDAGARDVTAVDVSRASSYARLAETRRIQATQGVKRALAALQEAVGLGPDAPLEVRAEGLPEVDVRPSRDTVVDWARTRRAELVRAVAFAEVVCLEVEAQGTSLLKRMDTFAAASDIHAVQVPQKEQNGAYRPGAVPPEMPTLLAGSRPERMKRAQSFHARALAVVDATRNLLALEAEDAFLRWEEAALQAKETREAADAGESLARDLNKDYTAGLKVKVEEVINAWVLASQARAQYNEALHRQILALADLERVTGGAFCARLAELDSAGAAPAQRKGDGPK
jgi:outer membrane protein TolC